MITEHTLDFLHALKENNNREWFQAHKQWYESAYGDFFDSVARMVTSIATFDQEIAQNLPDPKSCIMRIYRDTRFSRDKTPYKTGFFAYVSAGGRKGPLAGYYLHLEPGSSFAGGGLYMPDAAILEKTRSAIDSRFPEWVSIVTERDFTERFPAGVLPSGSTKRPPKGYDSKNPALEFLRYKGYFTQRFYNDKEVTGPDFHEALSETCRAVMPMVIFLNRAITAL